MKNINRYTLLAGVLAVSMLTSCDFEEINTNQLEMTDEEGIRDGFAMGGNVLSLQRTVLPVGTQADDTDVINQYQTSYHLSADCWSGFFSQNKTGVVFLILTSICWMDRLKLFIRQRIQLRWHLGRN